MDKEKEVNQDSEEKELTGLNRRTALKRMLGATSLLFGTSLSTKAWGQPSSPLIPLSGEISQPGESTPLIRMGMMTANPTMGGGGMTANPTMGGGGMTANPTMGGGGMTANPTMGGGGMTANPTMGGGGMTANPTMGGGGMTANPTMGGGGMTANPTMGGGGMTANPTMGGGGMTANPTMGGGGMTANPTMGGGGMTANPTMGGGGMTANPTMGGGGMTANPTMGGGGMTANPTMGGGGMTANPTMGGGGMTANPTMGGGGMTANPTMGGGGMTANPTMGGGGMTANPTMGGGGMTANPTMGGGGMTANPVALPVELSEFSGRVEGSDVRLFWRTETEINNKGFKLERSTDGFRFEQIAWIKGAGSTTSPQSYRYVDQRLLPMQLYYYRLNQIDHDGQNSYSEILVFNIEAKKTLLRDLYPNPATQNYVNVSIVTELPTESRILMLDAARRMIINQSAPLSQGNNTIQLDLSRIAAGTYTVTVTLPSGQFQSQQLIVSRD